MQIVSFYILKNVKISQVPSSAPKPLLYMDCEHGPSVYDLTETNWTELGTFGIFLFFQ